MARHDGRFTIQFREPVDVLVNFSGWREKKGVTKLERVKFFKSTTGDLCYTIHWRRGYWTSHLPYSKVFAIRPERDEQTPQEKRVAFARAVQRRIHPNAWDDLKAMTPEELARTLNGKSFYSLTSWMRDVRAARHLRDADLLERLKDSFEKKSELRTHVYGYRRDWTIETRTNQVPAP